MICAHSVSCAIHNLIKLLHLDLYHFEDQFILAYSSLSGLQCCNNMNVSEMIGKPQNIHILKTQ